MTFDKIEHLHSIHRAAQQWIADHPEGGFMQLFGPTDCLSACTSDPLECLALWIEPQGKHLVRFQMRRGELEVIVETACGTPRDGKH